MADLMITIIFFLGMLAGMLLLFAVLSLCGYRPSSRQANTKYIPQSPLRQEQDAARERRAELRKQGW